jgi:hypothetical protein
MTNSSDFIKKLYQNIAQNVPYEQKNILKELHRMFVRVNYTAQMDLDGKINFTPSLLSYDFDDSIEDIFRGLSKIAKSLDKEIVLAFDEFQQIKLIKDIKIDAQIKKYMLKYDDIKFIFTGLKRHLLKDLFTKKRAPLFDTVGFLELEPIPIEIFYKFVDERFDGRLSYELFEYIYNMTKGESNLIQEFCYHLYYKISNENSKTILQEDIDEVCETVLSSKSGYFRMILDRLTLPQKTALKAVVISNGKEIYSKSNLFKLQTTKSSLNTAIKYLFNEEIIDKDDNGYFISNRCFELWCNKTI